MDGIFTLSKSFDSAGGMVRSHRHYVGRSVLINNQAKSAKDLVALMDALLSPTSKESSARVPKTCFRIKEDWGNLRIGFTEPTIWSSWRKCGRINADAERFMVSVLFSPFNCYFWLFMVPAVHGLRECRRLRFRGSRMRPVGVACSADG